MLGIEWKKIIKIEALFFFLGLFIVIGIAESTATYVIIRKTTEFFLLLHSYITLYFLVLFARALVWTARNLIKSIPFRNFISIEMERKKLPMQKISVSSGYNSSNL